MPDDTNDPEGSAPSDINDLFRQLTRIWSPIASRTDYRARWEEAYRAALAAHQSGDAMKAEAQYRRAIEYGEQVPGVALLYSLLGLGGLYLREHRYPEAEPLYRRGLALWEENPGPDDMLAGRLSEYGAVLYSMGQFAEAESYARRAVDLRERLHGAESGEVALALENLVACLNAQGKYDDALPLYQRMKQIRGEPFNGLMPIPDPLELQAGIPAVPDADETRALCDELFAAVNAGDGKSVSRLLSAGARVSECEDQDGKSPLEIAAAAGFAEVVQHFVSAGALDGVPQWDVQSAFEAAADAGHKEVADILLEHGADLQGAYDFDHEEGERCPICYRPVWPGEGETCEHYICVSEGSDFIWFGGAEFNDELRELAAMLEGTPPEFAVPRSAPDYVRAAAEVIAADGPYYWTKRDGIQTVRWETGGMLGGAGYDYFHPDPGFAERIADEIDAVRHWLPTVPVAFVRQAGQHVSETGTPLLERRSEVTDGVLVAFREEVDPEYDFFPHPLVITWRQYFWSKGLVGDAIIAQIAQKRLPVPIREDASSNRSDPEMTYHLDAVISNPDDYIEPDQNEDPRVRSLSDALPAPGEWGHDGFEDKDSLEWFRLRFSEGRWLGNDEDTEFSVNSALGVSCLQYLLDELESGIEIYEVVVRGD